MNIRHRGKLALVLTIFAALALSSAPAEAQDSTSDEWYFQIAPLYLWASDLDGTLTARDQNVAFQVPFDQAFENLEVAFTLHFEAWKGRWGILTDFSYLDLASDQTVGPLELNVSFDNLIAEVAGGYLFDDASLIYLGARYYGVDSAVTGSQGRELQADKSWVDPIIGFGWRPALSKRWTLGATFDIGGFGIGSELTWKAAAVIDWQVGRFIALGAGYRALDIDYVDSSDGFAYDLRQQGPLAYLRFFW